MKKFKEFYNNNRVYVILMGIALFCLALIVAVLLVYFLSQNGTEAYGNRLTGIENVKIADADLKEIKAKIEESEVVDSATLRIKGKIIYINIYIKEGKASDAKNIAISSLEHFTDEEKEFYDISYILDITSDPENVTFPILGYKKSDRTIITWTKYSE